MEEAELLGPLFSEPQNSFLPSVVISNSHTALRFRSLICLRVFQTIGQTDIPPSSSSQLSAVYFSYYFDWTVLRMYVQECLE